MLDPNVINFFVIKIFLLLLRLLFPFIIVGIIIYLINKNLFYRILYAIAGKPWEAYTEKKRKEKEKADAEQRKEEEIKRSEAEKQKQIELEQQRTVAEIKRKQEEEKRRILEAEHEAEKREIFGRKLMEMFGNYIIGVKEIIVSDDLQDNMDENFYTNHELNLIFVNPEQSGAVAHYSGEKVEQKCAFSISINQEDTKRTIIYNNYDRRCTLEYDVMEGVITEDGKCPYVYLRFLYDKYNSNSSLKDGYYYIPYDERFKFADSDKMSDIHAICTWYNEYRKADRYPDIVQTSEYLNAPEKVKREKCICEYMGRTYSMRLGGAWYSDGTGIYLATYPKMDCFLTGSRFIKEDMEYTVLNDDSAEFWAPKMAFSKVKEYKRMLWNIFIPNSGTIKSDEENPKNKPAHQLDSLAITQSAIYCIEVKYWKTPITFKDIEHGDWYTASNVANHSPIGQNIYHIEKGLKPLFHSENFKKLLDDEETFNLLKALPIYNVVIFFGSNEIAPLFKTEWQGWVNEYLEKHPDVLIGYHQKIYDWLLQSEGKREKCLEVNQVNRIFDTLRKPQFILSQDEQNKVLEEKITQHQ